MKATGRSPLIALGLCVSAILIAVGAVGYKTRQYAVYLSSLVESSSKRVESKIISLETIRDRSRAETVVRAASQLDRDYVLVLGDSLVQMASLPARICGIPIVDGGVSGARASTLLPVLEEISIRERKPKLVIIAVGINNSANAYWDQRAFEVSYSELVRKAASVSRVAVATLAPIDVSMIAGKKRNATARTKINEFILATATQFNINTIRLDLLTPKESPTVDGVHLSSAANRLWLSNILNGAATVLGCSEEERDH